MRGKMIRKGNTMYFPRILLCFQFTDLEEIKYRNAFQKSQLKHAKQFN